MKFPEPFLETVRQHAQILEVAQSLGIPASGSGARTKLLCPFHDDTNPSMTIKDNRYRCWVCNERGDAISLVSKVQSCEFPEAVKAVCSISGIEIPQPTSPRELSEAEKKAKQVEAVLSYTSAQFREALKVDQRAEAYAAARGIDADVAERYAIGYAPRASRWIPNQHRQEFLPLLKDLGLVREGKGGTDDFYGFFRDRIIFPIRDARGRVNGFGGRIIDAGSNAQKYLNSPESTSFQKSDLLYGLYEATEQGRGRQDVIFVVEGYTDVIAMTRAGFPACSPMGTAVSRNQLRLLARWCQHVVFVFDGDKAGRRAADESASTCLGYAHLFGSIRFVDLPEGTDPDTLIADDGVGAMAQALSKCVMLTDKLAAQYDELFSSNGNALHLIRQQFLESCVLPLSDCPSQITRDLVGSELAEAMGIEWAIIDRFLSQRAPKATIAS
jgi:DNA primase